MKKIHITHPIMDKGDDTISHPYDGKNTKNHDETD